MFNIYQSSEIGGLIIISISKPTLKKLVVIICIFILIASPIFTGASLINNTPVRGSVRSPYVIDLNTTTAYQHQSVTIYGANGMDLSGTSVACADINNDGKADVITSSTWSDGPGEGRTACGEVYVIFYESLNETMDLSTDADMTIYGANSYDRCGQVLVTGDVNGDTIQDLIISATSADGPSETRNACGEIYVIYGNTTLPSTYDLSVTSPDVIIYGPGENDSCGYSLAIGDINGDNIDDILTGAYWADGPGDARTYCGEVHVVYGNVSLSSTIDLATQQNVTLYGIDSNDYCGASVAAGDVNNDGFDDIIMGAYGADGPGDARTSCGEVYLIYGNTTMPPTIDLAVNVDMKIYGTKMTTFGSYLGQAVAAGDVNLDNYDDLILGAVYDEVNSQRVGAVHVYYGAMTLPATQDLMSVRANVTIYGGNNMDRAGSKIITGDMNADSFDDIIFSALNADGPTDTRSACGEIYVINGSSMLPSFINLSTQDEDILIYGDETMDYTGSSLAVGNIDNDNVLDIVSGAIYADGPNNTKGSCGETYVILTTNTITPKLKPEFIGLTNGDGPDNKICYAMFKPYTFKVRVTDPNGYEDIDTVTLGLDYNGENLKCRWTRQTQQFQEISDPNDYVELSTTSKVKNLGLNSMMLYFNITFKWLYPDNELHGIQIYSDATSGLYGWLNKSSNIYQVENRVDFEGWLSVSGEYQGDLTANSWIRGAEQLNWKGVKVVYNGTIDHYPPDDAGAVVTVWGPLGNSWDDSPVPGEDIDIVTTTANTTQSGVIYKLNITGIPEICDLSNLSFMVNIDSDGVTFANATPLENHWQTTQKPNCGIVIYDLTTEVKVTTIQYRVSTDNGTTWPNGWADANIAAGDDNIVKCNVTPTLKNGIDNLIQWRAKDIVGNEFEASEISRVYIDVTHVTFNNATPRANEWQPDLDVVCEITIFDNLSGINASSIEYRTSTVGINNYSSWRSAGQILDANQIQCTVMPTFQEGTNNYIQWRAIDVIGNGPYESMDYQIKILLNNPPETRLLSPENGTIFQTQTPELL
ncbi:MAG: FG-GAP repeat protein, partial [Thermoplasmata archaeon]|nr:FG-GAP repeat protein [Thermoplasmata archaeon]